MARTGAITVAGGLETGGIPIAVAAAHLPKPDAPKPMETLHGMPIPPDRPADVLPSQPIPKDKARETLAEVAATAPATPEVETKHLEQVKLMLKEVGALLIDAKDIRSILVATSLSTNDSPMAQEFREHLLRSLITETSMKNLPPERQKEMSVQLQSFPKQSESPLKQFFLDHGYPTTMVNSMDMPHAVDVITNLRQKDKLDTMTTDMREILWDTSHPIPTTPDALAKTLGDNPDHTRAATIASMVRKEDMKTRLDSLKEQLKHHAPSGEVYIHAGFMIFEMMMRSFQQETQQEHQ
ncbi:MAG: hypothetical protein UU25_C0014G0009 [Microgenomates group bacterium GW2011_GWB1_40_9]|nr:MAG: hypothetical protein UT26_C0022G0009 [Microgenomates group bacterium GW2011_GWC1_39_12]KKR79424.1 MAG: hypothetical protein UU25_C0014G0009 [Microgenomates group bacterium GW2011_GWB1_40_9]